MYECVYYECTLTKQWDNLGKSTDMFNKIWLDDSLVTDARVRKYYSFKPRIEIRILYFDEVVGTFNKRCIDKILQKRGVSKDD